jgi:hypothetical protein
VAVGPADLLRARLALRGLASAPLSAAFNVDCGGDSRVATGWRDTDAGGVLAVALQLPPGPMASLAITLRHAGAAPVTVEFTGLALQAGAAGERRAVPPTMASGTHPGISRAMVAMPAAPALEAGGWRQAPPAPRLNVAAPGGAAPAPVFAPAPAAPRAASSSSSPSSSGRAPAPGNTAFQDFKVSQHLVNGEGTYRHLDMTVTGLVSGGGLWRQLRVKLFDRRGTIGLEFREMAGWPPMFDVWPGAGRDNYGPFWRLESAATEEALGKLSTGHDRAMIAALLDVLPELATRAAGASGLEAAEAGVWAARARDLAAAVAEARAG